MDRQRGDGRRRWDERGRDERDRNHDRNERDRERSPQRNTAHRSSPYRGTAARHSARRGEDRDSRASQNSRASQDVSALQNPRSAPVSRYATGANAVLPGDTAATADTAPKPVEEANFSTSGLLAAASNLVDGVVLKYHEPPEARAPTRPWRIYVFKGDEQVDMLPLTKQSAYLFGRERKVVDVPVDHTSCSKQHAVVQFRLVGAGGGRKTVRPYIIDLDATNGTLLNGVRIAPSRYYELQHKDVVAFGHSTREYVFLKEEQEEAEGKV